MDIDPLTARREVWRLTHGPQWPPATRAQNGYQAFYRSHQHLCRTIIRSESLWWRFTGLMCCRYD